MLLLKSFLKKNRFDVINVLPMLRIFGFGVLKPSCDMLTTCLLRSVYEPKSVLSNFEVNIIDLIFALPWGEKNVLRDLSVFLGDITLLSIKLVRDERWVRQVRPAISSMSLPHARNLTFTMLLLTLIFAFVVFVLLQSFGSLRRLLYRTSNLRPKYPA